MDCTKLCESRARQLFPETTTAPIDLSIYEDSSDYYNDDYEEYNNDPYSKYNHLGKCFYNLNLQ